jgi:hypothetical protein
MRYAREAHIRLMVRVLVRITHSHRADCSLSVVAGLLRDLAQLSSALCGKSATDARSK